MYIFSYFLYKHSIFKKMHYNFLQYFLYEHIHSRSLTTRNKDIYIDSIKRNLSILGIHCTIGIPVKHHPCVSIISSTADIIVWDPNSNNTHCSIIQFYSIKKNFKQNFDIYFSEMLDLCSRVHKNIAAVDSVIFIDLSEIGQYIRVLCSKRIITLDSGYPLIFYNEMSHSEIESIRNKYRMWYFQSKKNGFQNEPFEIYTYIRNIQQSFIPKTVYIIEDSEKIPLSEDELSINFKSMCTTLEI